MPHGFNDDKSREDIYSNDDIDEMYDHLLGGISSLSEDKANKSNPAFTGYVSAPTPDPASSFEFDDQVATVKYVKARRKETFKSATVKITASQAGTYFGSVTIPTGYEPMSVTVIAHNNYEIKSVTLVNSTTTKVDVMLQADAATTITAKVFFLKTGL